MQTLEHGSVRGSTVFLRRARGEIPGSYFALYPFFFTVGVHWRLQ